MITNILDIDDLPIWDEIKEPESHELVYIAGIRFREACGWEDSGKVLQYRGVAKHLGSYYDTEWRDIPEEMGWE